MKEGLNENGLLVVVDFAKKESPMGPPMEMRIEPKQVATELKAAGFSILSVDPASLKYQYVIVAQI